MSRTKRAARRGGKGAADRGARANANPKAKPSTTKPHSQPSQQKPTIPFKESDDILLIGEGDFSYAHSLLKHHRFHNLCATTFETRDTLLEKHPQAAAYIRDLEIGKPGKEEEGASGDEEVKVEEEDAELDEEDDGPTDGEEGGGSARDTEHRGTGEIKVLYGVDASRLEKQKYIKGRRWDRVVFNFPHVGGKSTDVNRQVRYNQELIVSFFKSAMPLLTLGASKPGFYTGSQAVPTGCQPGAIVVTLFEGTRYTLWNIRDLARHAGLTVETSFVFQASAYPGYRHARTLGNLKAKDEVKKLQEEHNKDSIHPEEEKHGVSDEENEDNEDDNAAASNSPAGAWRGETRPARTYIFKLKTEAAQSSRQKGQKNDSKKNKKRKASPDDSDSEPEGDGVKKDRIPLLPQDDLRPEPKGKHFKKSRPAPR